MKKLFIAVLAVLVVTAGMAACTSGKSSTTQSNNGTTIKGATTTTSANTKNTDLVTAVMQSYWKGMNAGSYDEVSATLSSDCLKANGAALKVAVAFSGGSPETIQNVTVSFNGNNASAKVYFTDGTEQTSDLILESGKWKVSVPSVPDTTTTK